MKEPPDLSVSWISSLTLQLRVFEDRRGEGFHVNSTWTWVSQSRDSLAESPRLSLQASFATFAALLEREGGSQSPTRVPLWARCLGNNVLFTFLVGR